MIDRIVLNVGVLAIGVEWLEVAAQPTGGGL